uniref:UDP-glucuronosyltransferase n=1 Tax=Leptobrachium leishanense TaxID=445787 RepID=A0A8C5Q023_9ANUR
MAVCAPMRIIFFLVSIKLACGGKLLVFPQDGSHWLSMKTSVEKLATRGHEIVLVIPETNFLLKDLGNYTVKTFSLPYTREFMDSTIKEGAKLMFRSMPFLQRITTLYKKVTNTTKWLLTSCEHFLKNDSLIRYLEQSKFDAMLTDPVFPCGEIAAEHLSIPSVQFLRGTHFGMDLEASQSPTPPSYVPRIFTQYTDHMSFSQRIKNFIVRVTDYFLCRIFYRPFAQLASDFLKRDISAVQLFSRASIRLMRYDFVFEYPRPVMPNMVFIGGINCVNRKPLTEEYEKLVNSSGEHGFVVFSLGSMVSELPMEKAMVIAKALGSVPQKVLWRYTGKAPSNLAENTHLVKWLPQNDLLAHPKARAFISHAGSHGIYEAVCNAVPAVMLPLFGDQMDNAVRLESRGAGVTLNVLHMTSEDLSNALKTVIEDPSYKKNIEHLSALHLDRPIHPVDLAVYWVEFVMRHKGAPHLRPAAHELNFFQYHSLDVIGFLLLVMITTLFISLKGCYFAFRRCCGKRPRPQSKTKSKAKPE